MFDIDKKACTLDHINIRDEKHGEENVLAVDLKLHGDFDGGILAEFAPALRSFMFKKADNPDLVEQADDAPTALRFPNLVQPIKFNNEIVGGDVTLAYGIGDITLQTCNINNFKVECHDGGTVRVSFRVQAKPTGDQLAKISTMLGTPVDVSIAPPEEKAQSDMLKKAA